MPRRTLVIGRSPFADIVVADASVAPHHLELVLTENGRLHATDCGSEAGTWLGAGDADGAGAWTRVRQAFIAADQPLRLGEHVTSAARLLAGVREGVTERRPLAEGGETAAPEPVDGGRARIRRGRVERDPRTGEIVQRRR